MLSTSAGKKLAAVVALLVVALGSVMLLASAAEDKHLKELNGDWTVVTAERSGKQASEDDRTAMKVTIKGNTLTIESGNRKEVATIRVDPTTTPASIDLTPARGKETEAGIYKLEGDQLTICWGAARPGERQQQFTTSEKGGGRLLILQRANSRKP